MHAFYSHSTHKKSQNRCSTRSNAMHTCVRLSRWSEWHHFGCALIKLQPIFCSLWMVVWGPRRAFSRQLKALSLCLSACRRISFPFRHVKHTLFDPQADFPCFSNDEGLEKQFNLVRRCVSVHALLLFARGKMVERRKNTRIICRALCFGALFKKQPGILVHLHLIRASFVFEAGKDS